MNLCKGTCHISRSSGSSYYRSPPGWGGGGGGGGLYERMIQLVKRILRKVLGNARLTYDELYTILVEVE